MWNSKGSWSRPAAILDDAMVEGGSMIEKVVCAACLVALALAGRAASDDLAAGFANPPDSARPQVWWHWMNGNVSKDGITADLEAFREKGIGGVHLFDVDYGIPKGPVTFNTSAWFDHVAWAAQEARRLGLEITVCTGSGWCTGGGCFLVRRTAPSDWNVLRKPAPTVTSLWWPIRSRCRTVRRPLRTFL